MLFIVEKRQNFFSKNIVPTRSLDDGRRCLLISFPIQQGFSLNNTSNRNGAFGMQFLGLKFIISTKCYLIKCCGLHWIDYRIALIICGLRCVLWSSVYFCFKAGSITRVPMQSSITRVPIQSFITRVPIQSSITTKLAKLSLMVWLIETRLWGPKW